MTEAFFFGYGSLVNRRTHAYAEAYPARVRGWRRAWRHTGLRETAFLSAVPAPEGEIEGLVAAVPQGDWAALDAREEGYDRHAVEALPPQALDGPTPAQIYAIPPEADRPRLCPILLSYLDVVVQGYLTEFGKAGARRFFATTDGWAAPVLDDRGAPRYPRSQDLTPDQTAFVDDALAELGIAPRS